MAVPAGPAKPRVWTIHMMGSFGDAAHVPQTAYNAIVSGPHIGPSDRVVEVVEADHARRVEAALSDLLGYAENLPVSENVTWDRIHGDDWRANMERARAALSGATTDDEED